MKVYAGNQQALSNQLEASSPTGRSSRQRARGAICLGASWLLCACGWWCTSNPRRCRLRLQCRWKRRRSHVADTLSGPLEYPGIGSGWRLEADTPEGGFIVVTPQGIDNV
jgi:hypothetical protein